MQGAHTGLQTSQGRQPSLSAAIPAQGKAPRPTSSLAHPVTVKSVIVTLAKNLGSLPEMHCGLFTAQPRSTTRQKKDSAGMSFSESGWLATHPGKVLLLPVRARCSDWPAGKAATALSKVYWPSS